MSPWPDNIQRNDNFFFTGRRRLLYNECNFHFNILTSIVDLEINGVKVDEMKVIPPALS